MPVILLATTNQHKAAEISSILGSTVRCLTLADFPEAPRAIEDAPDFAGNATKKAVCLVEWLARTGQPLRPDYVLADDSGLEVDALGGAPGVYSARFAAMDANSPGNSPDAENNAKLLRLLSDIPSERRTARFQCVIALTPALEASPRSKSSSPVCLVSEPEWQTKIFAGQCEGRILSAPRGAHGFGYDPLFVPDGFTETFAELGESAKNQISHRSKAMAKLAKWLAGQNVRAWTHTALHS